jgi:hypothetical protein
VPLGKSDALPRPAGGIPSTNPEASGIVASRQNPGVLWVHNDSGAPPRVFAINARGDLLGICNVGGAKIRDWEDIAVGPGSRSQSPFAPGHRP